MSRSARDQPQRVRTERRLEFIPRVRRCAAAAAGRCDTAALRPSAAGARLCPAPSGISRSASPPRGGSISSYASGDAQPLGLVAATQPRSVRAPPERGCVPRRAGSAAARPHGEAAQFHPTRPAMRSRWGWSLRHSRGPSERRRSAAVFRAGRDRPQRVPTERRLDFILRVRRCAAAAAGRRDTAALRPNAAGARLCPAPSGISRSTSARRGSSNSSHASGVRSRCGWSLRHSRAPGPAAASASIPPFQARGRR